MSLRKCEIVQQIKYLPGYPDHWKETLESNLNAEKNIKTWAYVLHDKDVNEDGTPVEPHVHIVIELYESRQFSTIGGYVGVQAQYVCAIRQRRKVGKRMMSDIGGALSYLTHRNAPDRYQYEDTDVIAKSGYDWQTVRAKSEMSMAECKTFSRVLDGIEKGQIRRYNLYEKVSMKMYLEHKIEFDRAFEFREMKLKSDSNRSIEVVYITGEAGAGKTTVAKQYCEQHGYSYCVSGSTRDPLQDYQGEDALILDDLRPETFSLADLLKLLDLHTASSAGARYHDKWLEVRIIIITTVLPIESFYCLMVGRDEPFEQLKRRCRTMIHLTRTTMDLYTYKPEIQNYMLIGTAANPVAPLIQEDSESKNEESLKELCADWNVEYKPEGLPSDYLD